MVVCPECGLTQKIPPDGAKHLYNCRSCGAPFAASTSMIFRIAKKLPPDEQGMLKIACPYCGWHYILGYDPKDGLVGCPKCLNIFVSPEAEWLKQDEATPATIPQPAEPASAAPAEELLRMPNMNVPPPPPRRSPVPTDTQHLTLPDAAVASRRSFTLPSQANTLRLTLPATPAPPEPPAAGGGAAAPAKSGRWLLIVFIVLALILATTLVVLLLMM